MALDPTLAHRPTRGLDRSEAALFVGRVDSPLRESDTKTYRGGITKQGSTLVRWSAVEAVSRYHGGAPIRSTYRRVAERRGRNIGRVAAARKLLTLVYYGLRDGEIQCLNQTA